MVFLEPPCVKVVGTHRERRVTDSIARAVELIDKSVVATRHPEWEVSTNIANFATKDPTVLAVISIEEARGLPSREREALFWTQCIFDDCYIVAEPDIRVGYDGDVVIRSQFRNPAKEVIVSWPRSDELRSYILERRQASGISLCQNTYFFDCCTGCVSLQTLHELLSPRRVALRKPGCEETNQLSAG
jgi:hypothetical protein